MLKKIILMAACACACLGAADNAKMTPERRKAFAEKSGNLEFDSYSARLSGDWYDDIWCVRRAYYEDRLGAPQRGKVPGKNDYAEINAGRGRTEVRLTKPAEVLCYYQATPDAHLVIGKGGALKINTRFDGQGSPDASGSFTVEKGGSLEVNNRFLIAGKLLASGNVTGVFNQNGGVVTLTAPLHLTGYFTVTSSPNATGIYNLREGALNIVTEPGKPGGILNGIGKGVFNFEGGSLNATVLSMDLENVKKGSLSPGGDGAVGSTVLTGEGGATYTQGKNARLSVDIGGRNKHDQLIWKSKNKGGAVVLEEGTTIWVQYLPGYRANAGAAFDIIECDRLELKGALKLDGPAAGDFSYEVSEGRRGAVLRLKYGR